MKVLMVEHFLPGSVYTLELCRALRTEEQITISAAKARPGHWKVCSGRISCMLAERDGQRP